MINNKSHYIQLDMSKSDEFRTISIWQGENKSNLLDIDLVHQFQSFNPTVTKTVILYDNEYGMPIVQSNATYVNGKISCTIPDGVYQSIGKARGQISLYNGEVKTQSGIFFIEVKQSVGIEAMAGRPEWGELDKAFEIANKAEEWKIQEDQRKTNELDRVKKENDRNTAESGRVSTEQARVSTEQARVSAESGRASAETNRVTSFNNIKKQYEDALALGNADVAMVAIRARLDAIEAQLAKATYLQ